MASRRSDLGVLEGTELRHDLKQALASADPPEPLEFVCRFAPTHGPPASASGAKAYTGTAGGSRPQELQLPPTNLVSSPLSAAQDTQPCSVDTHQEKAHVAQWVDTYGIPQKLMDWQPLESPSVSGRYSDGAARKATSAGRSTPGSMVDFTTGFRDTGSGLSTPGGAMLTWRSQLGNAPHLQQQQMLSDIGNGLLSYRSVRSDQALLNYRASQQQQVLVGSKSATSTGVSDSSQLWAVRSGFRLPTPPRSRFESSVGSPGPSGYSTPASCGAAIRAHPTIQQEHEAAAAAQVVANNEIEASTREDTEIMGAGALLSLVVSHPLQVIGVSGLILVLILFIPQMPQASPAFNCQARSSGELPQWPEQQRRWCCEYKKVGCEERGGNGVGAVASKAPTTWSTSAAPVANSSTPPFNCQDGLWNWTLWPKEQITWCCKHQLRFCPGKSSTTIPAANVDGHNCKDGNPLTWNTAKSSWCCEHYRLGCGDSSDDIDCQTGIESKEDSWPTAKKAWCCQRFKVGCGSNALPSAHECHSRQNNLSAADADVCCQHYQVACNRDDSMTTTTRVRLQEAYSCTPGSPMDEQRWPLQRRFWCCWHHKVGCLTQDDSKDGEQVQVQMQESSISCSDLSSASSLETRTWCCAHRAVGCSTTTALHRPSQFRCDVGIESCTATWSNDKRVWCRQYKGIVCQLTTQAPAVFIQCNNATRPWTHDERKFCCAHQPHLCGSEQLFNQWSSRTSARTRGQSLFRGSTGGALILLALLCLVLASKFYNTITKNRRCRGGYNPVPDGHLMI